MTFKEILQPTADTLSTCGTTIDANVLRMSGDETIYLISYLANVEEVAAAWLLTLYIPLDYAKLMEAYKQIHHVELYESNIILHVETVGHNMVPYLKLFNNTETDYDKIAEICFSKGGTVTRKRFGG